MWVGKKNMALIKIVSVLILAIEKKKPPNIILYNLEYIMGAPEITTVLQFTLCLAYFMNDYQGIQFIESHE